MAYKAQLVVEQGTRSDAQGSVLLLIPAGILIVLVLAAITLDSAVIFLAEREASSAAAAAANDLAALAADPQILRDSGEFTLDPAAANGALPFVEAAVREQLGAAFEPGSISVVVRILDDERIQVTVSGEAVRVIGPLGLAGIGGTTRVSARAIGSVGP